MVTKFSGTNAYHLDFTEGPDKTDRIAIIIGVVITTLRTRRLNQIRRQ